MRKFIIRFWRGIRGRCRYCGSKITPWNRHDIHSLGPYCRYHNKMLLWAGSYGAGVKKIEDMLEKSSR